MRTFTLKGLFLTAVFMLLGSLTIQAADDDLITKQITIKLDEAGTLPDRIASSRKYKITNLKIVGEINGTDLQKICDMAGYDYHSGSTKGNLSVLDLSEAKIVSGGEAYYGYFDTNKRENIFYYTYEDKIGDYAFYGCAKLTSLTLPSNLTKIGKNAFEGCRGLTSLNLPAGITTIDYYTFLGCTGLTSVTLPESITEIGYGAFRGCTGLTSLNLPASITTINGYAFYGCTGLTNLTLPASLTWIGHSAFEGCRGLTSLTLPAGITSIGESAFENCTELTSVTLPSSLYRIYYDAFHGCSALKEVRFCINDDLETYLTKGHPYINVDCDIKYYLNDKEITSIVIPSNVNSLGDYAFQKCSTLQSVYVSWPTPISAGKAFNEVDVSKCTLYVPQGTEQDYWLAEVWCDFGNIVEFDATGIDKTTTSTDIEEVVRYSVNGQRLVGPTKGLNIVKYSDGSVKKVAVQ